MPERPWCQYNRYKENGYPMLAELNVLNLKGQLTSDQAAFLSPNKPEVELYDLRSDPHELKNLADNPDPATVRAEMLAELQRWRKEVIHDQGVSKEFRGRGTFPASCPESKVDDWVEANAESYDFNLDVDGPSNKEEAKKRERDYIENASIRGLGGRFIVDYSDRERREGEAIRAILCRMVKNFLISDLDVKDSFTVYCGVTAKGCAYAVTIDLGGVKKQELARNPNAKNGRFADGTSIKNVRAVFGRDAQIKTHAILEIPEEHLDDLRLRKVTKFFDGPSIGAVKDSTEGAYHVIVENVTLDGFKYNNDRKILTPEGNRSRAGGAAHSDLAGLPSPNPAP